MRKKTALMLTLLLIALSAFACVNNTEPNGSYFTLDVPMRINALKSEDAFFDISTSRVVVLSTDISIYDAKDMSLLKTISSEKKATSAAVDNGVLAFTEFESKDIIFYNLSTLKKITSLRCEYEPKKVDLDGDTLIYKEGGSVFTLKWRQPTAKPNCIVGNSSSSYCLNKKDKMIYLVGDHGGYPCKLTYYNYTTGDKIYDQDESAWNYTPGSFDGKNVHAFGKVYDPKTGQRISETPLTQTYPPVSNFMPSTTIFDSDDYAIIIGNVVATENVNKTYSGLYRKSDGKFIYFLKFYCYSATRISNDIFFIIGSFSGPQAVFLNMALFSETDAIL